LLRLDPFPKRSIDHKIDILISMFRIDGYSWIVYPPNPEYLIGKSLPYRLDVGKI